MLGHSLVRVPFFQLMLTATSPDTLSHLTTGETVAERDKVTCFFRLYSWSPAELGFECFPPQV